MTNGAWRTLAFGLLLAWGCESDPPGQGGVDGGDSSPDAGTMDADPGGGLTFVPDIMVEFDPVTIPTGHEDDTLCQSWTLDNDESIFVHRIRQENDGGFHHSNWVFTDESNYEGPDGVWPCDDRGFSQVAAGLSGGVFFAQSTQAPAEEQGFQPGAALELPPRSRIVGQLHVLNVTDQDLHSSMRFFVQTLEPREVQVRLGPAAYTNTGLVIAPNGETAARMQCPVPVQDFALHYVLPHYHGLGERMRIDVVGGPDHGKVVFTSAGSYGGPLGQTFDPPLQLTGVTALGITCDYTNPRDAEVGYGIGDQEMCVALLYTDNGFKSGGLATVVNSSEVVEGVNQTQSTCLAYDTPLSEDSALLPPGGAQ